jgi:hypothetical protein
MLKINAYRYVRKLIIAPRRIPAQNYTLDTTQIFVPSQKLYIGLQHVRNNSF